VSAKVESLHEFFDEIGNFNEETANSEASESDRKFSPQERQLFHELDEDDESIQSDRDFSSPHAEQERQRETAGTMEQGKGISDAPAHYDEPSDISSSYYSLVISRLCNSNSMWMTYATTVNYRKFQKLLHSRIELLTFRL
jgi:hypothetical protein